jgi:steroid 5-alpha reductase family enzyme
MELLFETYFLLALLVFCYMSLWFIYSLWKKRSDVADVAWGFGFLAVALATFVGGGIAFDRGFLVTALVVVWALRLSLHIFLRNRGKGEDRRYAKWREEWGTWFPIRAFFQVFVLQGALLLVVVVPIVTINIARGGVWTALDVLGILLWLIGFAFETIGDFQLIRFVRNPEHRGKILRTGLWKYTRHPNYFGEVLLWWGIFIIGLSTPLGWIGIVGPLTLTTLILFVSGVPLLEKGMAGNPEFEIYKKETSMFFPWFPKRI